MKVPRVLNIRTEPATPHAIYVGRPSKWGNPFIIGKDGSREGVVMKYKRYILRSHALMGALHELTGRDLICYCAPLACHADVLLELANPPDTSDIKEADKSFFERAKLVQPKEKP